MTRPPREEPAQLVAVIPKNRREAVTVTVAGDPADWRVELRSVSTFPDNKMVSGPNRFGLKPSMLRAVASALLAIAEATDLPDDGLPDPEELERDIRRAPQHLKCIVGVVGRGRAALLTAQPGPRPFRVHVNGPSILIVDDAAAAGPDGFDLTCLLVALKRAGLVVLTFDQRVAEHYHTAAGKALEGLHVVIVEAQQQKAGEWLAMLAVEVPDVPVLMHQAASVIEPAGSVH